MATKHIHHFQNIISLQVATTPLMAITQIHTNWNTTMGMGTTSTLGSMDTTSTHASLSTMLHTQSRTIFGRH